MPINRSTDRQGRTVYEFEFSRRIQGQRVRVRRSLPPGWTRAQADAYDRAESARLYAVATGTEKPRHLIEDAVARYLIERVPELKHGLSQMREVDLMEPWFRNRFLDELPDACAGYLRDHRAELAPATIKNRMRYLVAACRWAWKHPPKLIENDPGAGVVYPAVKNQRQVRIDRSQMVMMAKACKHRAVRALIRIAFYSGMRQGEILSASIEGNCFVIPDTKNGEPRRVPIHPKVRTCVRYTWPTRYIIGYHFRKARAAVFLDHVTFHDERHSTATEMISNGVALDTVGRVLGHKSRQSTLRYAHHETEVLEAALNTIGRRA